MNQRAHPTVRPYALALGVIPRRGVTEQLSFLGPAVAQDLATALLLDTLGALSTFPVRHRLVFTDGDDAVTRHSRLPATWREVAQRGETANERLINAFEDLVSLGAEAMLVVTADGPMMPLGQMFDGMMWLLPKNRLLVGGNENGGIFALGAAERLPFLPAIDRPLGLGGSVGDAVSLDTEDYVAGKAGEVGLEVQRLPKSYRVEDMAALKRLKKDVSEGMFAPQSRKLFERPDVAALG